MTTPVLTNDAGCGKLFQYRLIESVPNRTERFRKLRRSTVFGEYITREVQIECTQLLKPAVNSTALPKAMY